MKAHLLVSNNRVRFLILRTRKHGIKFAKQYLNDILAIIINQTIMKKSNLLMSTLALLAFLIVTTTSLSAANPPWAPAKGYDKKTTHVFLPEHNVYYDLKTDLYFFEENGIWRESRAVPVSLYGIDLRNSRQMEINMKGNEPYTKIVEHRNTYHKEVKAEQDAYLKEQKRELQEAEKAQKEAEKAYKAEEKALKEKIKAEKAAIKAEEKAQKEAEKARKQKIKEEKRAAAAQKKIEKAEKKAEKARLKAEKEAKAMQKKLEKVEKQAAKAERKAEKLRDKMEN